MRVAIVAPLAEPVPPPLYGGTERVASILTEELVRRGHCVTLFASGDSRTSAELVACSQRGLRLDPRVKDTVASTLLELHEVYRRADDFDLIHSHVDYLVFPFARLSKTPTISTAHGRLDLDEVRHLYQCFPEHCLISISNDQRTPLPDANWIGTVYHGMDLSQFHFRPTPGDYLVFLGRMSPEKRPDRAIAIAREVGMRLVMAAKVDPTERAYFEACIAPMIAASPCVEFIGEVDEAEKDELLGGAYAYLFPIDWPEPFGLTMVESMATGTPVVAYRAGAVPEVLVNGVTGFVCDSVREMTMAVERVASLDRHACRDHVECRFSQSAMADGYERLYDLVTACR
jgi:glycosyltransferase involved in cell wall biosynthesis